MIPCDYRLPIVEDLSRVRRQMAAAGPQAFARTYLQHHIKVAPSQMHLELYKLLQEASTARQQRIAIAAPRGHAKTTIVSLVYVLWSVLYGKEKFVLLVSATREQAVQLLKAIRDELQTNPLLISDFPECCNPPGRKPAPTPWKEHQIVLPNGSAIRALGANQGLRGVKHNQHRPSLIIADDLENADTVIFEEQRDRLHRWFSGTLMKAGEPSTNVVVIGTVLHHHSLLASLTAPTSSWTARVYAAIKRFSDQPPLWEKWVAIFRGDEEFEGDVGPDAARAYYEAHRQALLAGTEVLWPELEDYYHLMVLREQEGKASFMAEKQNQPLDPAQCTFQEQNFHYWDDRYADADALCEGLGRRGYFVAACDPALGTRRGDYTAIVVVYHADDKFYVIAADIARRSPEEMLTRLVEFGQLYPLRIITVEINNFQELLVGLLRKELEDAGLTVHIQELNSQKKKRGRIAALEPHVTQGRLLFSRRQHTLLQQLADFPLARYDDGPDALEMAVKTVRIELWGDRLPEVKIIPYRDL